MQKSLIKNKKAQNVMMQLIPFVVGLVAVTFVLGFGGTLTEKLNETVCQGVAGNGSCATRNTTQNGAFAMRDTAGYLGLIALGFVGVLLLSIVAFYQMKKR